MIALAGGGYCVTRPIKRYMSSFLLSTAGRKELCSLLLPLATTGSGNLLPRPRRLPTRPLRLKRRRLTAPPR